MIFGRYRIIRLLGIGAMGVVYLVEDCFSRQRVALKQVKKEHIDGWTLSRLGYEFRLAAALRHPYIIRVYDFWVNPLTKTPFYTMEYIAGDTLRATSAALPVHIRLRILLKICKALSVLHGLSILHLDISAQNILVRRDSLEPVLMDFGIARYEQDVSNELISGTPQYIAPEIITGDSPKGCYSDIFSLGVLFFHVLTGTYPFPASRLQEQVDKVKGARISGLELLRKRLPGELCDCISRMLSYWPGDRPETCADILEVLQRHVHVVPQAKPGITYLFNSRFVGRETIIRDIVHTCKQHFSENQSSRFIFIFGPQGIGKTRLLKELRVFLQTAGVVSIQGRTARIQECGFDPVVALLAQLHAYLGAFDVVDRQITEPVSIVEKTLTLNMSFARPHRYKPVVPKGHTPGDTGGYVQELKAFLLRLQQDIQHLIAEYTSLQLSPLERRGTRKSSTQALYACTWEVLRQIAGIVNLCLEFDDVDDDADMIDFIRYLVHKSRQKSGGPGFLLVMTSRKTSLSGCEAGDCVHWFKVRPLTRRDSQTMVSSMLAVPLPRAVFMTAFARARGKPLHIAETIRCLFLRGFICWNKINWQLDGIKASKRPLAAFTLRGVIRENLDYLPPTQREFLKVLALVDVWIDSSALDHVFGDPALVRDCLCDLVEQRLVVSSFTSRNTRCYRMSLRLYRREILRQLESMEQKALSGRLLTALLLGLPGSSMPDTIMFQLADAAGRHRAAYLFAKLCAARRIKHFALEDGRCMLRHAIRHLKRAKGMTAYKRSCRFMHLYNLYISHCFIHGRGSNFRRVVTRGIAIGVTLLKQPRVPVSAYIHLSSFYNRFAEYSQLNGQDPTAVLQKGFLCATRAMAFDPRNIVAINNLAANRTMYAGYLLYCGRNPQQPYQQAIRLYERGIDLYGSVPFFYTNLAHCLQGLAEYDLARGLNPEPRMQRAIVWLRKTIALNPHYLHAYNNIGCAYNTIGQYCMQSGKDPTPACSKAIEVFSQALKMHSAFLHALINRGIARFYMGTYRCKRGIAPQSVLCRALADLRAAMRLNNQIPHVHFTMAQAYRLLANHRQLAGHKAEALVSRSAGLFTRALAMEPMNADMYSCFSDLYLDTAITVRESPRRREQYFLQARQVLRLGLERLPGNRALACLLVQAYCWQGLRDTEAALSFAQANKLYAPMRGIKDKSVCCTACLLGLLRSVCTKHIQEFDCVLVAGLEAGDCQNGVRDAEAALYGRMAKALIAGDTNDAAQRLAAFKTAVAPLLQSDRMLFFRYKKILLPHVERLLQHAP